MEDTSSEDWPSRACCRWLVYVVLWILAVGTSLFSTMHLALKVCGALLGCVLAVSLPLIFATLFETAYSRRARHDLPLICCPLIGSIVVLMGAVALQQASPLVVWRYSQEPLNSARDLFEKYSNVPHATLPRAVCLRSAFVKTDWEAGKLECTERDGHVACEPEFIAAPLFDDKFSAEASLAKDVRGWAVTHGPHAIAAYQFDGSLCGYLQGTSDLDFYLGSYRLAIDRVVEKYNLVLAEPVAGLSEEEAPPVIPLADRPLLMVSDPTTMSSNEEIWLLIAVLLLGFCPCVGPLPLGVIFCFWCWSRQDDRYQGRRQVATDEYDDGFDIYNYELSKLPKSQARI